MIQLQIENKKMYVDGKGVDLLTAPMQVNDNTTMVPIRAVAEGFGFIAEWDEPTKTVTIYNRKKYFETVDECAYDWCMHWHCYSMASARELGGVIHKTDKGYYWDDITIGKENAKTVAFNLVRAKKGVALIHSHSTGKPTKTDGLSPGDINISNRYNIPIYMVNSSGELYLYNPNDRTDKLVRNGLPSDARHLDITKSAKAQAEYFASGYRSLDEYEQGYKADYYNKLHMKGKSYLKEVAVL